MFLLLLISLSFSHQALACFFDDLVPKDALLKAGSIPVLSEYMGYFELNRTFNLKMIRFEFLETARRAKAENNLAEEMNAEIEYRERIFYYEKHFKVLTNALFVLVNEAPRENKIPPILREMLSLGSFLRFHQVSDELKVEVLGLLSQGVSVVPSDSKADRFSAIVNSAPFIQLKEMLLNRQAEGDLYNARWLPFNPANWPATPD